MPPPVREIWLLSSVIPVSYTHLDVYKRQTLVTPGIARHCLLLGTWALVAGDKSFAVVDISNPSSPRVLGQLDGIFGAEAVDAVGARAYLATSEGLVIVDLSDPSRPRKLAALELSLIHI